MTKLAFILAPIIAVVVIVWVVLLSLQMTPTSDPEKVKRSSALLLPDGGVLAQPKKFYRDHQAATLTYLIGVYPQGARSLRALNYLQLAAFYNSLWFYYNCESSFDATLKSPRSGSDGVKTRNCWQALPGCGKDFPRLPYTPQGFLYSIADWIQSDTPFVYSNSTMPASYFGLGVPGVPFWGADTVGPGPLFMHQRSIFRNVYSNKLPLMQTWTNRRNGTFSFTQPTLVPGLVGEFRPYWNYPKNWSLGVPKNGWIEVLSADDPGMPISVTIMWLNGAPGSGIFYNVGNVVCARNKVDGVFILASEVAKTEDGRKALIDVFNSSDPYDIIATLLDNPCAQKGGKVWDPSNEVATACNWCAGGQTLGSIPSRSTPAYGWSTESYIFNVNDWYSYCDVKNAVTVPGRAAGGIPNACIDSMRAGSNFLSDRIGSQGSFDEPLTWMGCWCGYDTIELVQSANGDGTSQIEILVLKNLPAETKNRDYSAFLQLPLIKNETTGNLVATCQEGKFYVIPRQDKLDGFYAPYFQNFWAGLSLRDPLDINNNSKATTCQQPPWDKTRNGYNGDQYNLVCMNNSSKMLDRLNAYAKVSPDSYTEWNKCSPFGVGAGGKTMTTGEVWPSG